MTVDVLLTIFVSLFVLCLFEKQIQLVFLSMAIVWLLLRRQYPFCKNLKLYGKLFAVSIMFTILYILKMVHEEGCLESIDLKEVRCFGLLLISVCLITLAIDMVYRFIRWVFKRFSKKPLSQNELYMERRHDIEKVQRYLETFNMVVLDAAWGSGKSFIASNLMSDEKMCKKYIFVPLSLLSCNLEEAQNIIVNELSKVLAKHGVFSRYSKKLQKIIAGNEYTKPFSFFFQQDEDSIAEAIAGLKKEVGKIGKPVVLVVDDIDRIDSETQIRKIFSIVEHILCDKLRVIYEIDLNNLQNVYKGLGREYLEKYLPYIVKLTEIPFLRSVQYAIEDNELLEAKDFYFLVNAHPFYGEWQELFGKMDNYSITPCGFSMRRIETFIKEITESLKIHSEWFEKEKKTVILFYFIKHFVQEDYDELNVRNGLMNHPWFINEDRQVSLGEFLQQIEILDKRTREKKVRVFLESEKNMRRLIYVQMLDYRMQYDETILHTYKVTKKVMEELKKKTHNDKKDRVISNLLMSGQSFLSDEQYALREVRKIFALQKEEQEQGWEDLCNRMYHGKFDYAGVHTVSRIGIPFIQSIFQSFYLSDATEDDWCNLLDRYFSLKKDKVLHTEDIARLNFCDLHYRSVYHKILQWFNGRELLYDYKEEDYLCFLEKYLSALSYNNVMNTPECSYIRCELSEKINNPEAWSAIDNVVLESLEKRLIEMQNVFGETFLDAKKDIELIISFIRKNREIITMENASKEKRGPRIETRMSSRYKHQEYVDELQEVREKKPEAFIAMVQSAYHLEKIDLAEIFALLKK